MWRVQVNCSQSDLCEWDIRAPDVFGSELVLDEEWTIRLLWNGEQIKALITDGYHGNADFMNTYTWNKVINRVLPLLGTTGLVDINCLRSAMNCNIGMPYLLASPSSPLHLSHFSLTCPNSPQCQLFKKKMNWGKHSKTQVKKSPRALQNSIY